MDARYIHRDGQAIWVHLSVWLVRDADGQPRHVLPIIQDITARWRYGAPQAGNANYAWVNTSSTMA